MSSSGRRGRSERLGALALLTVCLLVAAAQQPSSAAGKKRKSPTVANQVSVAPAPAPAPVAAASVAEPPGYWLVGSDGGIYAYGASPFKGSTGALKLNKPVVGMAPTPSGQGYWLVASDGGIFSFGDAAFHGSTGAITLNKPIVGMASTPSGAGYWLVASDGGIFAFGDAAFTGSTGAITLNKPIVGMAPTRSGKGYWLVASDGGIFAFGDAAFKGSTGNLKLVKPITGMAGTGTGGGYWMTASDGGLFSFGDARYFGAAREKVTNPEVGRGVVGMVATKSGAGYWQVAASGKVFAFGDAAGLGGPTSAKATIVGIATRAPAALPVGAPTAVKVTAVALPSGPAPQLFASIPNSTWGTSPSQVEKDKAGNRVFVGGEFAGMVPPAFNRKDAAAAPIVARPYLAALDVTSGALLDWDVHPDDAVLAMAVSVDRRTLYVGGRFSQIAGGAAERIAAIDIESGRLISSFQPPAPDGAVKAMFLFGNTLYIGGDFEGVGAAARPQVAAIDAATGALREGFVPPQNNGGYYQGHTGSPTTGSNNGAVHDLGVTADGRYLVVGGDFLDFGGHGGLIILDAVTGQATPWQAAMDRPVFGVAMWPGDSRTFFVSTGGSGGTLQAFHIEDSAAPSDSGSSSGGRHRTHSGNSSSSKGAPALWEHRVDGDATDVVATTQRVYLVGHYDWVLGNNTICHGSSCTGGAAGDVPNRHISAFEPNGGAHDTGFTGQLNTPQGPYGALIGANSLYVVGDFTEVNQAPQPGFVQFPAVG
ncbi:MAG: PQQ-like beta-propeller repeat protein [Actinobacteria bacterium]|nr:PQQ-like beta-propeller repeat protein [Actinomycetota bacterium]